MNISVLDLTVNELLTFEIYGLEKVDQGQGLQLSPWRHSMANTKISKSGKHISVLALTVNEI